MKIGYRIVTEYNVYDPHTIIRGGDLERQEYSGIFEQEPTIEDIKEEREKVLEKLKIGFGKHFEHVKMTESWIRKVYFD